MGKTSLFRAIAGLWPSSGQISLPAASADGRPGMLFLPQTPYLGHHEGHEAREASGDGALADILAYPNSGRSVPTHRLQVTLPRCSCSCACVCAVALCRLRLPAVAISTARSTHAVCAVQSLLEEVGLEHLVQSKADRGGLSTEERSLGEMQRLALARLLFQRPHFAVLDEATSTLDEAMVERLYRACEDERITVVSVSHRPKHKRFHAQQLTLEGEGRWRLHAVDQCSTPRSVSQQLGSSSPAGFPPSLDLQVDGDDDDDDDDDEAGPATAENRLRMPEATVLQRFKMIWRVLVPRLSLRNRRSALPRKYAGGSTLLLECPRLQLTSCAARCPQPAARAGQCGLHLLHGGVDEQSAGRAARQAASACNAGRSGRIHQLGGGGARLPGCFCRRDVLRHLVGA